MSDDISSDNSKSINNTSRNQIKPERYEEEDDKESEEKEEKREEEDDEEEEDKKKNFKKIKKESYEEFLIKLLSTPNLRKGNHSLVLKPIKKNLKSSNNSSFLDNSLHNIITEPRNSRQNLNKSQSKSKSKSKKSKKHKSKSLKKLKGQKEKKKSKDLKDKKLNFETKFKDYRFHLNYLYGYDKKFYYLRKSAKAHKKINNLQNYQEELIKVSSHNLSKDNMAKLASNLKAIRLNCETSEPLPPINYPALVHHSVAESSTKKKYGIKFSSKRNNEMDDYEREIQKIKSITRHKKIHQNTNRKLYKMYEILPGYVIEALFNKK